MRTRDDSDEAYVVGLCSQVLGETALTQHKFDGLQGDPGTGGRLAELPVDVYWPGHQLVVEYRELQHDQPMLHFDKPDRLTVSGVHRGEQRAMYDARSDTQIPAHGLRLIVIRPADLDADGRGRLRRNRETDLATLKRILARYRDEDGVTDAFRTWLLAEGWTPVHPMNRWTDLEAVRGETTPSWNSHCRPSPPARTGRSRPSQRSWHAIPPRRQRWPRSPRTSGSVWAVGPS